MVYTLGLGSSLLKGKGSSPFFNKFLFIIYFKTLIYKNNIKKANINENKAIASVKANPKIAALKRSFFNVGFLAIPRINAEKTNPIPNPAPVSPVVASPAPIFCADCKIITT